MIEMACDAGVGGGFCYKSGPNTVKVFNMPKGDREQRAKLIVDYLTFLKPKTLWIEKVRAWRELRNSRWCLPCGGHQRGSHHPAGLAEDAGPEA